MNIEKKIKKICKKLEKENGGTVLCGKVMNGVEKTTIPVLLIKPEIKDQHRSSYNQPIGIIEIHHKKVRFIPIDGRKTALATILKTIILVVTLFGLKKFFKVGKKWHSDN